MIQTSLLHTNTHCLLPAVDGVAACPARSSSRRAPMQLPCTHSPPSTTTTVCARRYAALRGGYPLTTVDKQKNVALLKTKGGNLVAATQVRAAGV